MKKQVNYTTVSHSEIHILPTNMSKQWVKRVGRNMYEDDWIITNGGCRDEIKFNKGFGEEKEYV